MAKAANKKDSKSKAKAKAKVAKAPAKAPAKKEAPKQAAKAAAPVKATKSSSKEQSPAPKAKVLPPPPVPGKLGHKRECLKCRTKFYDFERNPIVCPKCMAEFDPSDFEIKIPLKADKQKPKPVEKDEEESTDVVVVGEASEDFESLEELGDAEDEIVDDLAAANTGDGESFE